jgi:myo-inositol-1(or 4)-monophosphatase
MKMWDTTALEALCKSCLPIIEQAGDYIESQLGKVGKGEIEEKSLFSLVSFVDKTAEQLLVEGLKPLVPGAGFITEEETPDEAVEEATWVIDPLDGTTNFLHQLPSFAVSVALAAFGEIVLGIIYDPNRKEMFYCWKGGGAYCNGRRINASNCKGLNEALIATGFPYVHTDRLRGHFAVVEHLQQRSRGIRRWGASAIDLAYVACGRFEAYFEYALHPWDVAAGILLIEEAGGKVTDFQGRRGDYSGREVLAANSFLHEELLELIRGSFRA